ncbi:MAG: DUF1847 domain-containing protein [Polyangia bacterium]|jgi:uncharacterized metal-binding protein|nr:DUF1847 domain-containing protein [Polyangia bacterium]
MPQKKRPRKRPVKCAACPKKVCHELGVDCFEECADPRGALSVEDRRVLLCASEIEAEHYCRLTRVEEIIEFSKRMGYERLGLAFCIGLANEARLLDQVLSRSFEVYSVCCKACGLDKRELGLKKIRGEGMDETMCNPVGQAMLLNAKDTQLNLILGLCIGHDLLFTKHSRAPVSTFAVKDRVLAHNPLGALYSRYHRAPRLGLD